MTRSQTISSYNNIVIVCRAVTSGRIEDYNNYYRY